MSRSRMNPTPTHAPLRSARWHAPGGLHGDRRPPRALADWLFDPGSLTRALRREFGASLRLQVDGESWRRPGAGEARWLDVSTRHRCLERRVVLLLNGQPVVLGCSLIPCSTLRGRNRRLLRLGARPLGEALFSDRSVQRRILAVTPMKPGTHPFPGLDQAAWLRHSLFQVNDRPLMVVEAFLPRLVDAPLPAPAHRPAA